MFGSRSNGRHVVRDNDDHNLLRPTRGERIARTATDFIGSVRFIVYQSIVVALWIALNVAAIGFRWDPYPFILLNLAFSLQAAYATPLILLAQNRQAVIDEELAERDDRWLREIHSHLDPKGETRP